MDAWWEEKGRRTLDTHLLFKSEFPFLSACGVDHSTALGLCFPHLLKKRKSGLVTPAASNSGSEGYRALLPKALRGAGYP